MVAVGFNPRTGCRAHTIRRVATTERRATVADQAVCRFNPATAGPAPAERMFGHYKHRLATSFRRFLAFSATRP